MSDLSTAYDGISKRRQRRKLEPLERDILTRILDDILRELRQTQNLDSLMFVRGHGGIRMEASEVEIIMNIREAINPRSE